MPEDKKHKINIKPQSEAIKRIVKLQSGVRENEDGELIPVICPKIDGRIIDITAEDDFGSYKFLHDKEESITQASVEKAPHLEIDLVDI